MSACAIEGTPCYSKSAYLLESHEMNSPVSSVVQFSGALSKHSHGGRPAQVPLINMLYELSRRFHTRGVNAARGQWFYVAVQLKSDSEKKLYRIVVL